jgi:hypothetical protein
LNPIHGALKRKERQTLKGPVLTHGNLVGIKRCIDFYHFYHIIKVGDVFYSAAITNSQHVGAVRLQRFE